MRIETGVTHGRAVWGFFRAVLGQQVSSAGRALPAGPLPAGPVWLALGFWKTIRRVYY